MKKRLISLITSAAMLVMLLAGLKLEAYAKTYTITYDPNGGTPGQGFVETEQVTLSDTTQEVAEVTEPTTDGGEIDGLFDANTAQQALTTEEARQQAILDTIVYSVYNGAKFYHVAGTCRDQTNRRALTIREAISEGLKPCGRCNPPTL